MIQPILAAITSLENDPEKVQAELDICSFTELLRLSTRVSPAFLSAAKLERLVRGEPTELKQEIASSPDSSVLVEKMEQYADVFKELADKWDNELSSEDDDIEPE